MSSISHVLRRHRLAPLAVLLASTLLLAAGRAESPFLAECRAAMATMMQGMHVGSTGDADADFAAIMIPHHEGAIAMARSELKFGTNPQLRRLAQEIIITQQQEIVAMRMASPARTPRDSSFSASPGASR
ncbi:MAG TPA: DUF305 domain-containing protein [Gemmatimonadaceae bacterium]|nr:DUF305 domain-containing protein [Gemmatimonadaceae bacterium]